jgi:hypothetical protein
MYHLATLVRRYIHTYMIKKVFVWKLGIKKYFSGAWNQGDQIGLFFAFWAIV